MWSNITLDIIYTTNYNFGFPTTRTDSLLRITHWQYWWWFWFTYFLVLYYFLILRLFRFRVLKFRPKIATTTRSHGKWGDLIVCLLPISWCANILTNSNLILRMLEWQSESSLFTVRVRGKQWYWIYKFELKAITDILSAPKNIGHNKWVISVFNELKTADDYLHIMQLRSQNNWLNVYWNSIFERNQKDPNFYVSSPQELLLSDYHKFSTKKNMHQSVVQGTKEDFDLFKQIIISTRARKLAVQGENIPINTWITNKEAHQLFKSVKAQQLSELFTKHQEGNPYVDSMHLKDLLYVYKPTVKSKSQLAGKNSLPKAHELLFIDCLHKLPDLRGIQERLDATTWESLELPFKMTQRPSELRPITLKEFAVRFAQLRRAWDKEFPLSPLTEDDTELFAEFVPEYIRHVFPKKWEVDVQYLEYMSNRTFKEELKGCYKFLLKDYQRPQPTKAVVAPRLLEPLSLNKLTNSAQFNSYTFDSTKNININVIKNLLKSKQINHNFLPTITRSSHATMSIFNNPEFIEINRWLKLSDEVKLPVRVLKNPLKYSNFNDEQFILNKDFKLLRLRFNETSDLLQHKNLPHATYLVYKQKRYQRRDKFVPKYGFEFPITIAKPRQDFQYLESVEGTQDTVSAQKLDTSINPKTTKQKKPVNIYLQGNQLIVDNLESVLPNYRAIRKNKNNSESMHNNLNRRLLRTKRTLVLPAHVNITIITNSYDVIHSWFIPGLGLKLDCIPGRATHHMLHIENVGFYYGQCAEICGRYHHHMPIRICALPFEHFLVWWHTFGLPKMLNTSAKSKLNNLYSVKKYSW